MAKIPQTKTKGVAKVPVVMQLEMLECGAACLDMILAYYGKFLPLEQVRSDCGVNRNGSIASNIIKAANGYGLDYKAYKMEPEDLQKQGTYPCIIHWGFNHFVVLNGFRGNYAYINDPDRGRIKVSMEEFDSQFTGVVLFFSPGENFKTSGKGRTLNGYISKALKNYKAESLIILICSVVLGIASIVYLAFSRVFIDNVINPEISEWLFPFLQVFACTTLFVATVRFFVKYIKIKTSKKIETVASYSYFWKALHLPIVFFEQRLSDEISHRLNNNKNIAEMIVDVIIPILAGIIMMVVYFVLLLCQFKVIPIIGIAAILINIAIDIYSQKVRDNLIRIKIRDIGNLQSYTISGTHMIEEIKATGAEHGFIDKWRALQKNVIEDKSKEIAKLRMCAVIPETIKTTINLLILLGGVYLIVTKNPQDLGLGYIYFAQGILLLFFEPITKILQFRSACQTIGHKIDQIEDVTEYGIDQTFKNKTPLSDESVMSGQISINKITFGYSKLDKPIISDFTMHAEPGAKIAICGKSGSGKSTVAKLIANLYKPWSGTITFDGKSHDQINRNMFLQYTSICEQDVKLVDGSIADNIKMWDELVTDEQMFDAAKDAQIHDEIMLMSGGYQHNCFKGGVDLSGGQRQRIEIARALALNPKICILDEATSSLDAITESKIIDALHKRNITCIIIAHRLSTIRNCDEIIVLDKGEIVERGKHKDLIEANGHYHELVQNG